MLMKSLKYPIFGIGMLIFLISCSPPDCIQCEGVDNYPDAIICKDSYETSLENQTPSWKEYTQEALSSGCQVYE